MPPKTNEYITLYDLRGSWAEESAKKIILQRINTKIDTIIKEKDKEREEAVAREHLRLARVVIDASMIDEDEINEEDFDGVSKVDAFMNGVEHVHRAFREALTPPTKDIKEQMRQPQQYTKEQQAQRQAMIEQAN